jgi:hypothetical protein
MDKQKLTGFVEKYSLGNNIEAVKWAISNNSLQTEFISGCKTLLGVVKLNDFQMQDCELGIYNTSQLQKMLSVVGNSIDLKLKMVEERAIGLTITDNDVALNYMLADLDVIPKAPKLKATPEATTRIKITNDFIMKFIKAKNALSDAEHFTVISNTITQIILGHSDINSNRININVSAESDSNMDPISFNADYLREILAANKDNEEGLMEVSADGLAVLTFKNKEYVSKYYMVQTNVN